jgi:hypothetical protein
VFSGYFMRTDGRILVDTAGFASVPEDDCVNISRQQSFNKEKTIIVNVS